jgi:dihydroorotase
MTVELVISNALVTSSTSSALGGVAIHGGKIVRVGDVSGFSAERTIDARGLPLIPGLIDTQVHFREPGLEHKEDIESGTRAALHGGVTSILEMPNTVPATVDERALLDKLERASGRAWCHYGFFVGATGENDSELARLENSPGCPGIKIFMGSSTGSLLVDRDEILERVLRNGVKRCPIHAEDEARNRERKSLLSPHPSAAEHPFLRDAESARLATERILSLSARTGRPVHILHVSTADELPLIQAAKSCGLGTTCEVTPQHLAFFAPECYERLGSHVQMNPPIRAREHGQALWKGLGEGLFDVFGSDHAPHTLAEKAKPYPDSPSGMPGVQTTLPVLMNFISEGRLSLFDVVRMGCENPASLYRISHKGHIREGFDADLVVVDPDWARTVDKPLLQSKCGWSPYEGMVLKGWPRWVIVNGTLAVKDDVRLGGPQGRMLRFDG